MAIVFQVYQTATGYQLIPPITVTSMVVPTLSNVKQDML